MEKMIMGVYPTKYPPNILRRYDRLMGVYMDNFP